MRRTAWLVLSPWLVVAVVSLVAWGVGLLLVEAFTTDDGGMGNIGGALLAVLVAGLVWCGGSVGLLYIVARRAFPSSLARAAAGWTVLAAVIGAVLVGSATGLLGPSAVPVMAGLIPVCLPAAGTAAFLVTERRLTGRAVPLPHGSRRVLAVAALAALAGGLVGATVGGGVGLLLLRPSQSDLEAAARDLVPPGYLQDEPVPINGTVMLLATPSTVTRDAVDVRAGIVAAGWRIDGDERSSGEATFEVVRGNVEGTVSVQGKGAFPDSVFPYTVTVRPGPLDTRSVIAGGVLGMAAGAVGVLVRRRREDEVVAPVAGPGTPPPEPRSWTP